MKVIQTEYNGLLFRSRLEARFAYLFDLLGVEYEYEKEGYELRSGRYLPDFWLPTQKCWVEIKGDTPNGAEQSLAADLANATKYNVYLFFGQIPDGVTFETDSAYCCFPEDGWDCSYRFCVCTDCGAVGIEFDGRSDRLPCKNSGACKRSGHGDKGYTYDDPFIVGAYRKARKVRFEYGETPSKPYPNVVNYDQIAF